MNAKLSFLLVPKIVTEKERKKEMTKEERMSIRNITNSEKRERE
jgi:hypothetical protein